MTDTPSTPDGPEPAHSALQVLTAIDDLGEATAATIAQHADLAYSTVTPKLRAWETSGHAEKYRHTATNQTLWRLTATGRATTGTTDDTALHATDSPVTPAAPSDMSSTEIDPTPSHIEAERHDVEEPETEEPETEEANIEQVAVEEAEAVEPGPDADVADVQPAPPTSDADADPLPADATGAAASADDADTAAAPKPAAVARRKRPAGALEASVLTILRNRPDETFKVNDLRKLVDRADEGTGYPAASGGAISNALTKLTGKGAVDTVEEKPATYQATPAGD